MEADLIRIVNALPGLVWTARPDGDIDFLSRGWCEYTGLSFVEAAGWGWQGAILPSDLPEILERWDALRVSGKPGEIEAQLRRFDGEYRRFLICASPLTDQSGHVVKWCGINIDVEDRNRAEEELHARWWLWEPAREHHFRAIANELPALAIQTTRTGEVEHANRKFLEYFGVPLNDLKGRQVTFGIHADDLPVVITAWRKLIAIGAPYDVECRLRRVDGMYRWFHVGGFPLRDSEGRVVSYYLLLSDVDDRKRGELLFARQTQLLEVVAAGQSMSGVLDALCRLVEGTVGGCFCSIVLADPSGARITHGAAPSLPASFITTIVGLPLNPDSGPSATALCLNRQVILADLEWEDRWEESEWRPLALENGLRACWSTPIPSTDGGVVGEFSIYYSAASVPTQQDQTVIGQITHIARIAIGRAQSDAALKRSERFLAEARRLSSTGGFSKSGAADDITWSEEVYRMYEFDPAEPVTLEMIYSRIHPDDLPFVLEQSSRQEEGKDYDHEFRLLLPDGSIKYLHVVGRTSLDEDGHHECYATIQDVTQRRLAEEALAKARSELAHVSRVMSLGALTASIAHEVNQPLSGIITNASTCLRMLAGAEPNLDGAREIARRIIRDGNRASDVTARLRALFSKKAVTAEQVDLNEAAHEVIALSRSELQANGVIVRTKFSNDLPAVLGDRVQIQQVILNLLLNASDAMSEVTDRPRHLLILTEYEPGEETRLIVRDVGVGFIEEDVERLFDAFYTTKADGMGMGLAISRSIVESLNGRLSAISNDGPGATFYFSIPHRSDAMLQPAGRKR
jgi:PAS domain S-box-containing protein